MKQSISGEAMAGEFYFPRENLPKTLPLFVLPSILLLPQGRLPLNIFEPRYIAMVDAALSRPDRMIGIIQSQETPADETPLPLHKVGCAGRIVSFAETEKNTYLISLQGISRFAVGKEMPLENGFRRIVPEWAAYEHDLLPPAHGIIERGRLFAALRHYFKMHEITANWEVIEETSDDNLITSLAMTCPLAPWEHQALLDAATVAERAHLLMTMIEMAALEEGRKDAVFH